MAELIAHSVNELTTRAKNENKEILVDGDREQLLVCDMEWTSEAIGNIVKNALDHTQSLNSVTSVNHFSFGLFASKFLLI